MASMRVHELAKEFDMSSGDLLDRLKEMKIPAKSHASMLNEAYVDKIRKNLEPEIRARAGALAAEEEAALAAEKEEAERQRAEEEAARKAAREKELAEREAARAQRESARADEPAREGEGRTVRKAPVTNSSFASLEQQIASEKERVEREREEARARARAEKAAAEVAKKRAVEEALRRGHKKSAKAAAPEAPKHAPAPAPAPTVRKANFDSLLSQIEAEKQRMEAQKSAEAEARRSGRGAGKKGKKGSGHQVVPELEAQQAAPEDRYAQMAVQAEKLQRDKVLAEARAAVAAATTHEGEGRRKKRKEKREAEARERAEAEAIERGLDPTLVLDDSVVEIPQGATVAKFAELLGVQPNDVIKRLFMLGQVLTLTQSMNDETMELIADDMGRKVRVVSPEEEYAVVYNDSEADLKPRPPVVTVMGHVDHGKTSLLDAIRDTGVVASEAGGITQHIGASVVNIGDRQITFIDTPGHEAFTAMRARGAQVTDVIVLVVAADDGVMPQTIEAINHAKAAEVPIVVAVNKIDKPGANPDRVRQELTEYGVIPEEWGGSNMFVEVSAKKKLHIDDLLETIILQADVLELKANPDAEASGFVIEANLDKGRGPVATVLIQRGTLHTGDVVVAGTSYGRVRALVNPRGEHVGEACPADPVEILGLNSVPTAGDEFRVFEDERDARKLAEERALRARLAAQETKSHMSLDDLFSRIEDGKTTDLNLIVKADVQGSIEALRDAFDKMDQSEVRINIVHSAVGGITETDVTLAAASDAIIIGFNVRPTGKSRVQAEKEKVDIRLYRVIYQAIEDINAARVGLLSPDIVEVDTGIAEVRDTFKVPKVGTIAGCYIIEGEINRDDKVRIVRDGTVIFEGHMASLRRFKDDVKSVKQGYECGIGIEKFQDLKVGDTIEGYQAKEVERTE
ncbi:translation initiation factor IF-2 [Adlercreutzia muris]|uniref:Translation initiation factor IF-2 n=2 Tax=Adlercreutzia TaxID=447020 RepID=A0A7C8FU57_9ACTN|nr:translation initiation factor IF-2 [Adlercreutzia muris]KAB1650937.1 translation initiation factor IF-2 [Adlercreutzia muris]MCR2028855.1 translation initiation factor IF-2 [Adlercreutzia muris]